VTEAVLGDFQRQAAAMRLEGTDWDHSEAAEALTEGLRVLANERKEVEVERLMNQLQRSVRTNLQDDLADIFAKSPRDLWERVGGAVAAAVQREKTSATKRLSGACRGKVRRTLPRRGPLTRWHRGRPRTGVPPRIPHERGRAGGGVERPPRSRGGDAHGAHAQRPRRHHAGGAPAAAVRLVYLYDWL